MKFYLLLALILLAQLTLSFNLREEDNDLKYDEELDQLEKDILELQQKYKDDPDLKVRLINRKKVEKILKEKEQKRQQQDIDTQEFFAYQQGSSQNQDDNGEEYEYQQYGASSPLDIKKLVKAYADYCLKDMKTGKLPKDSSKMNLRERLDAFNKGPCSPTILMPGILGSKLQVTIDDCEALKEKQPDTFSNCGWSSCSGSLFKSAPKAEYQLWIGGLTSPMSLFSLGSPNKASSKCLGDLMQLKYNKDATSPDEKYTSIDGVSVTIVGDTSGSRDLSQCGDTAVARLFYSTSIDWLDCSFNGFYDMQQLLKAMGYIPGITYQSVPYDFRRQIVDTNSNKKIKKTLMSFQKYTGKKANIITHSYGSLHTLNGLSQLSQEFKDKHINQWIPTGGPLSGAPKLIKAVLNTDEDFIQTFGSILGKSLTVGIQFDSQRQVMENSLSTFDLYPKDVQYIHKDTDWMKQIFKRMDYEEAISKGEAYDGEVPFSFLPNPNAICRPGKKDNENCNTYLYNQLDKPLATIQDNDYYLKSEDLIKMIKDYCIIDDEVSKFNDAYFNEPITQLTNPGVKVTTVYGAFEKVYTQFLYEENVAEYTERNEYYFPKYTQSTFGDGTVTSSSALTGPLKWSYEFEKHGKTDSSYKPIKLVEMCSAESVKTNPYDGKNEDGSLSYDKNGYMGLDCQCFYTGNTENCQHPCMISEPFYLEFIANTLADKQISKFQTEELPDEFDHYFLSDQISICPNLFPDDIDDDLSKDDDDSQQQQSVIEEILI